MKLEVGMYVRTEDGYIAKYDNSEHNCSGEYYGFDNTIRDIRWEIYDDDCFLWKSEFNTIVKASHNIIDLIEVGDFVNGFRVDFIENIDSPILKIQKVFCEEYEKDLYSKSFNVKNIKSIVTKEQFESMSSKVQ